MKVNKHRFFNSFLWLIVAFSASLSAAAQKPKPAVKVIPATVENHKLNSKLMAREIPYSVILPDDYKNKKTRYAVVFLLHGLMGHFDNWATKTELASYARDHDYIFVMPEGGDGWYTDSVSENNDRYESYMIEELIPEIDKKFRTLADKDHRAIAGFSMGGYGAIKFGIKHSKVFAVVASFSGVLGAARATEKEIRNGDVLRSIQKVFGADDSAARSANDLFQLTRDLESKSVKELPFIYFDCGTEDGYFQYNLDYAKLLREKKITHEFRELPGGHSWKYWDAQVQEFLRLSDKYFK